jgi:hypothetical protein
MVRARLLPEAALIYRAFLFEAHGLPHGIPQPLLEEARATLRA